MHIPLFALLLAVPALPFVAALIVRLLTPAAAGRLTVGAATVSAGLASVAAMLLMCDGPSGEAGWLRLDAVSAVMVVLVSFLGTVVLRFSRHYLAGDPGQTRFFCWMSLTLGSVLLLVLSSHLLVLAAAWIATSLCLHRLLLHYPERAGAVFSARKKFVFSRAGDVCLLGAAVLLHGAHGTWELDALFASVASGNTGGLPAAGFLIALCAMLKSAQFPFHSWLPDTMETPTPVSAFMHAGIINAGGFLVVRLSPLFVHASGALTLLVVIGTLTAAFGAVVMLAQPSVKRALAYSTIAQMGFMMLQCGLGAFGLALLHIAAHSLYKAHAFLTAGSTIGKVPRAAIPLTTPALSLGVLVAALLVTGLATALHILVPHGAVHAGLFGLILTLAIAYGVARAWSAGGGAGMAVQSVAAAAGVALASLALHTGSTLLFSGIVAVPIPSVVLGFVALVFIGLFFFQALLWRTGRHAAGRALYVHALNGFYIGTVANRLLNHLWPRQTVG